MSDILRGIAAKQRVSPTDLAQRTGYHRSKINRLLNGKTILGIDEADRLSAALGVSFDAVVIEAMAEVPDRPGRTSTAAERLRSI